jgi:hypothetical protein
LFRVNTASSKLAAFADLFYLCLITSFLNLRKESSGPTFKKPGRPVCQSSRTGRKRLMAIGAGFLPFAFRIKFFKGISKNQLLI